MTELQKIPLCVPDIGEAERNAVLEVLDSGWLAHGPYNKEFEAAFAKLLDVPHCVSLNSCASALFLALKAANITGEVILPSFTFVASANAVINAGGRCVFVDVDYDTCNINPDAIEAAITPQTEAIMPVHFAGHVADMERIAAIAEKHGLFLMEDSAEAIGATQNGTLAGGWGTGCFSFFPTKNITTGEGGMLTTRDENLAARARALSGHGIASTTLAREKIEKPWLRAATYAGFNCRMSNLLAAIGVRQMERLDEMNAARRQWAGIYDEGLDPTYFDLAVERQGCRHVYQMYTIKVKGINRTRFLKSLREGGIGASVHFDPPVHSQPYYVEAGMGALELPVTEQVTQSIVTLPMYPSMGSKGAARVVEAANQAAAGAIAAE